MRYRKHHLDDLRDKMKMATKVIDYRLIDGKRYYKVKWECTWELEDNLLYCQDLVEQFWDFVDRVKSEDNRFPLRKKARCDNSETGASEYFASISTSEQKKHDVKSRIREKIFNGNGNTAQGFPKLKLDNNLTKPDLRREDGGKLDDDRLDVIQVVVGEITKSSMSTVAVPHTVDCEGNNLSSVDDDNHQQPPCRNESQTQPVLKKSISEKDFENGISESSSSKSPSLFDNRRYETTDADSEHNSVEDMEMDRDVSKLADEIEEQDPNDIALHWRNPFVRISFRCRICSEEQPFSNNDENWKKHFLTHVEGAPHEEEITEQCISNNATLADAGILQDPEKPWIQKVEYIIQKWGVNQYVRLAFLCRSCGKEQQPLHTGNWRNHYNSHKLSRPHPCQKCSKTFKSRSYLNQHLKMVHDEVEGVGLHSCFICEKVFTRRQDMQRHIADIHKINPKNQYTQIEFKSNPVVISNPSHDIVFANTNCDERMGINNHSPPSKESTKLPSLPNSKSISLEHSQKCRKSAEIHSLKSEVRKHRKHYNLPSENSYEKKNFKHVCGICQERFKKKIDLKSHTVNVHCIDIHHSLNNSDLYGSESRESLTPTMVDIVQNTSGRTLKDHTSRAGAVQPFHEPLKSQTEVNTELLIIVKEEVIDSEDEFNSSGLTIDERPSSG